MKIGFTGTLKGMSELQKKWFETLIEHHLQWTEFHHGAAVGADMEAEDILMDYWSGNRTDDILLQNGIYRHPAGDRPLERDKEIVAIIDVLVAAPRTDREVLRSGTWATVRYARAKGIPIIFLPRGDR